MIRTPTKKHAPYLFVFIVEEVALFHKEPFLEGKNAGKLIEGRGPVGRNTIFVMLGSRGPVCISISWW